MKKKNYGVKSFLTVSSSSGRGCILLSPRPSGPSLVLQIPQSTLILIFMTLPHSPSTLSRSLPSSKCYRKCFRKYCPIKVLSIHLLLMEKSLESLDPPASDSDPPMEELPSPASVRLPSSSQEGRMGEV